MKTIKTNGLTNTISLILPELVKIEIPEEVERNCITNTKSYILDKQILDLLKLDDLK